MGSKAKESGRKSISPWMTCEKCQSTLTQKDLSIHESNCPPNFNEWCHDFIHNGTLYGTIEIYKPQEQPKNISGRALDDMVFVSQSVLQLCDIAIADPVLIVAGKSTIVKTAWPTKEKSLTSVSVTKHVIELNDLRGPIKVKRLDRSVNIAQEFVISSIGKHAPPEASTELDIILKNHSEKKIFSVDNVFSVPFYGRKLIYKIVKAISDGRANDISNDLQQLSIKEQMPEPEFYKALYSTRWTILKEDEDKQKEQKEVKYKMKDIGGYEKVVADIRDVLDIGLGKCQSIGDFYVNKGVLLFGPSGVGKSVIANALISESNVNSVTIYSSDIYSKSLGETEKRLQDIFADAKAKAPSIILIEEIDSLCPKRSSSTTDHERRVLSQLVALFDDIQNTNDRVMILATTSKLDFVDSSLRRPGRIDKEYEIYVPTRPIRVEILEKMLSKVPNTLCSSDVERIGFVTHGFVGADLYGLCSQAILNAVKRERKELNLTINHTGPGKVTPTDFEQALKVVKPSAMKEVLIEVPNVRWTDIGGQEDLKLKLKQAVEWPLRHPEAFQRMGITPPKGVLMFGPPGCSKTMIAKALAFESKVNFLNIKGPELFSKWVGESEKAVREVFRRARQVSPSIIFIDEIDALGGERSSSSNGGSNVQERVLAQLLTELDGVTALGSVTLVGATNRPDKIDKALLRPGRLDRIIYVPLPDYRTRQEIFYIKLRSMPIAKDVQIQDLVELTEGYTGAEIQAICHEAALKALEEDLNASVITKEHFKAALAIITPRTPTSLINLYNDYINKAH